MIAPVVPGGVATQGAGGAQGTTIFSAQVGYFTARRPYTSALDATDVSALDAAHVRSTDVSSATNMCPTADVFTATPMAATMAATTAFGRRCLNSETY